MRSLQDIKMTLSSHKQQLFKDYPIKSLAIFGSYSRREQNDSSDLDILVELNGKIGIRFVDLADEIEQLVGLKVDLVSKNGVKDKYLQAISTDLIYV
jgi:predicted nucleotidyltransferase